MCERPSLHPRQRAAEDWGRGMHLRQPGVEDRNTELQAPQSRQIQRPCRQMQLRTRHSELILDRRWIQAGTILVGHAIIGQAGIEGQWQSLRIDSHVDISGQGDEMGARYGKGE